MTTPDLICSGALAVMLTVSVCCATLQLGRMRTVEEHACVRVRIHHVGQGRCQIEIITATETLQTTPTRCAALPHRATP